MKNILIIVSAGLFLLIAPRARAWTYQDEQALLIFRKPGFNNVEFNLGSVSNFLNKPNGYSAVVGNWSLSRVTDTFGPDLSSDVRIIVLATTSSFSSTPRAWVSSAQLNTQVYNTTPAGWQGSYYAKINAIGSKPLLYEASATNAYVVAPTFIASYDYIASDSGVHASSLNKLGGAVPFLVEQAIPATLKFWEVTPGGFATPATSVGTFTLGTNGVLTFTVGSITPPAPASIVSITRSNGISAVTFTTATNGNYQLRFASTLGSSVTNWPVVAGPVSGGGTNTTLTHPTTGAAGYYSVETTP